MSERGWDDLVKQVEKELSERGPSATDDRRVRFLIAAYLRDIRDLLRKQSGRVAAPPPGSTWDISDVVRQEDDGDTRPFAFVDELRVPVRQEDGAKGEDKKTGK
jgi:hypothetical protein